MAGRGKTASDYQPGQVIFSQGDPADSIFYIQKGKVKITVVSSQGKEAVTGILNAGDFFGEACLAGQPVRTSGAAAMSGSTITRLDTAAAVRVLRNEPTFSEMFLGHLLSRNIRIEEDLVDQFFNFSEERLARVLLRMANFGNGDEAEVVIPKISQETLAEIVGTTRSRISFFMNKFRRLGFIRYNGGLKVHRSLHAVTRHD